MHQALCGDWGRGSVKRLHEVRKSGGKHLRLAAVNDDVGLAAGGVTPRESNLQRLLRLSQLMPTCWWPSCPKPFAHHAFVVL